MSTAAQIAANQANSQRSTGPRSEAGKAISARNHANHGLSGALNEPGMPFAVLPWECQELFEHRLADLIRDHQPRTETESVLIHHMAQHNWLRDRAIQLQENLFQEPELDEKRFALYLRYQTTHERAFHRCLNDFLKLRSEKRRTEIGFESQKRREAEESRKKEKHEMKKECHKFVVLLAEARLDGQIITNLNNRVAAMPQSSIPTHSAS
ncbi:MAG TPA: hypothetical protein VGL97_06920 [Bryobacteraceae bacterium]|jgi:hypothetical protein